MKTIYFVTLVVMDDCAEYPQILTEVVDDNDVKSISEALGIAMVRNTINPGRTLIDHATREYTYNDEGDERQNFDHTIELAQNTFLTLLTISSGTIMQNIHASLLATNQGKQETLPNRIPAIKMLRDHLKPHIGLKSCKEIVEQWIDEILDYKEKTSLVRLVTELLNSGVNGR